MSYNYYPVLAKCRLFSGISEEGMSTVLACLTAYPKAYAKKEIIMMAGDKPDFIGVILSGKIQILKEDLFGNRTILAEFGESHLFAEAFACAEMNSLPVTVVASTDVEILKINMSAMLNTCSSACSHHSMLIKNMMRILANKNVLLNEKIEIMSKRTTREKLLAYLYSQSQKSGKQEFKIPFDRQELADYLGVDRSAMSAELSKLKSEGYIDYKKNLFALLNV